MSLRGVWEGRFGDNNGWQGYHPEATSFVFPQRVASPIPFSPRKVPHIPSSTIPKDSPRQLGTRDLVALSRQAWYRGGFLPVPRRDDGPVGATAAAETLAFVPQGKRGTGSAHMVGQEDKLYSVQLVAVTVTARCAVFECCKHSILQSSRPLVNRSIPPSTRLAALPDYPGAGLGSLAPRSPYPSHNLISPPAYPPDAYIPRRSGEFGSELQTPKKSPQKTPSEYLPQEDVPFPDQVRDTCSLSVSPPPSHVMAVRRPSAADVTAQPADAGSGGEKSPAGNEQASSA
ncbi:hypothetical protein K456DRAFT_302001 [Colletotrichum gloeosporioides 23]|nr:hypothetical protein K456DRAFT_302001 [Colletotrichum gloeosporioides 23]